MSGPDKDDERQPFDQLENAGSTLRTRQQYAEAFFQLVGQLIEEDITVDIEESRQETLLDAIGKTGLSKVADAAWSSLEPRPEHFTQADPHDVREYLARVRTYPRIRIVDLGAVDEQLVKELRLSQEYVEEIRHLLSFFDADSEELSVLSLPDIQRKMHGMERSAFKKVIAQVVLEMHHIGGVLDQDDRAQWNDIYKLAERLSSELHRDYSRYLRKRKKDGKEKVPQLDVYEALDDIERSQQKAIDLAMENADSTTWERQRLLETLQPRVRKQVEEFFESIDKLHADGEGDTEPSE